MGVYHEQVEDLTQGDHLVRSQHYHLEARPEKYRPRGYLTLIRVPCSATWQISRTAEREQVFVR
jgi:hypothetical protein